MQLKNEVYDPFEQAAIYYKFIPQFDSYLTANNIKIIWVSSYPRSGNRFFNTLLYFTLFPQNTDFSNFYLSPTSSLYGYSSWPEHYFSWKKLHLYSTIKFISLDYDFLCNDHSAFHICMKEFGINLTTTRLEEIYTLSSWSNAERFQRKMIEQNSEVGGFRDRQGNPMTHLTPKSVKEKVLRFALPYKQGLDEKFRAWTSII